MPLAQIQMRLYAKRVERCVYAPEPLQQLEHQVTAIAFLRKIVFEAEFVDHQLRVRREDSSLFERAIDVLRAEDGEKDAFAQPVHPVARVQWFVDDFPLRDDVAVAGNYRAEIPAQSDSNRGGRAASRRPIGACRDAITACGPEASCRARSQTPPAHRPDRS